MRIAVMAAGAVGGYYGARMAVAGHDVTFIARGAHRDVIRQDGLKIESALGDLHLKDAKVTDDPKQVGPVDLVLFAVKLWDTETAGAQMRPLVAANTRVITLQNGVDSVERLSMGSAAQDRACRVGERTVGAATAGKLDWVGGKGSLSRQRARLSPHDCGHRFPPNADQSPGDRAFCHDFPGFRNEISCQALGDQGLAR
jgi:2-dehydropantoate 2-reductase